MDARKQKTNELQAGEADNPMHLEMLREARDWCARTDQCLQESREIIDDLTQRLRRTRPR